MPSTPIYIVKAGEQLGPFPSDQISALIENGNFSWDDLAWREGLEQWVPLYQVCHGLSSDVAPRQVRAGDVEDETKPGSFFRELMNAFVYPFRGSGAWAILLFGTMLVAIMIVLRFVPLIGLIVSFLLTGYYIAFLFKIIKETAVGEQEMAEFPGLQDFWDDLLLPFVRVILASVACVLPSLLVAGFLPDGSAQLIWIPVALFFGGLFCLPMVLLAMVIFDSLLTALNPVLFIPAISRIFFRYLVIVVLLGATWVGYTYLAETLEEQLLWYVAIPFISFLGFYIGIIQACIVGLIYRTSAEKIGWFNH